MPRGRQQELRLWLPPALYERVLRDAALRGVSLSRCVRDRLEAHLALEEELLDVVEKKDARQGHGATGAALRLRLIDELEERLVATLGRQAASLEMLVSDLRLVLCSVDVAYLGFLGNVTFKDLSDRVARVAAAEKLHQRWRKAVHRLWRDGGPVFAPEEADHEKPEGG